MKPILFNTEMVRTILDGRKTVTRRIIKTPPTATLIHFGKWGYAWSFWADGSYHQIEPPYRPGDILYVRETWTTLIGEYIYKADQKPNMKNPGKWRPSIHMPREAARIFLEVTDVRAERLRDITADDALREGVKPLSETPKGCRACGPGVPHYPECSYELCGNYKSFECERAVLPFIEVWNGTIKPADRDRFGWDANPWVWVIEFEQYLLPDVPKKKPEPEWRDAP